MHTLSIAAVIAGLFAITPAVSQTAAPDKPETTTGVDEFAGLLLPSCPTSFRPQQRTDPDANSAHACHLLESTATAVLIPLTGTGVAMFAPDVPLPSCP